MSVFSIRKYFAYRKQLRAVQAEFSHAKTMEQLAALQSEFDALEVDATNERLIAEDQEHQISALEARLEKLKKFLPPES